MAVTSVKDDYKYYAGLGLTQLHKYYMYIGLGILADIVCVMCSSVKMARIRFRI